MSSIRERLTFANVMSVAAVFIALGGTAWAISANSVGSKQIKPKAVKNSDLADNAVTSPKVKDGSLLGADFATGQLPAGAPGSPGQDATKLFAYIAEKTTPLGGNAAVVQYGSGVTAVEDSAGDDGTYLVTFNRSIENCVVDAVQGQGKPDAGGYITDLAFAQVRLAFGTAAQGRVQFVTTSGISYDTSFMVFALC